MNTYFFVNCKNGNEIELSADNSFNALDMLEVNYENAEDYLLEYNKTIYNSRVNKQNVKEKYELLAGPKPNNDFYNQPSYPLTCLGKIKNFGDIITTKKQVNTNSYDEVYN